MAVARSSIGLALAVLMAVFIYAEAHGGSLHVAKPNYSKKTVAGTCSEWVVPGNTSTIRASKVASGDRRLTQAGVIAVDGIANMTVRMNKNCTDDYSTAVLLNVTITEGGAPLSNVFINGSVTTGSCASGGGDLYLLNASMGITDYNLVFFKPNATNSSGRIVGSFVNDGIVDTSGPDSAKSVVLYRAGLPISCCTLKISAPAKGYEAYLASMGEKCAANDSSHGTHGSSHGSTTHGSSHNGTTHSGEEPLGMTMGGKWMECSKVNGTYQMDHGSGSWAKCLEYKNGTRVSASSVGAAPSTPKSASTPSAAAISFSTATPLVVRCAVGLVGAWFMW